MTWKTRANVVSWVVAAAAGVGVWFAMNSPNGWMVAGLAAVAVYIAVAIGMGYLEGRAERRRRERGQ